MKNNQGSDGGYYAIKGFEFQIDKTILELLDTDSADKKINIEKIQDIDSDGFVMQVKYRETQKYSPVKIREAVRQLIEEFSNNFQEMPSKIYYLYCHFSDKNKEVVTINLSDLNKILGENSKIQEKVKEYFVKNFVLVFSPTFHQQFELVIEKIKKLFGCNKIDEAVLYYSIMANHIRKVVVNNTNKNKRICTKKQIVEPILSGKKLIFDSAYKEYLGELDYLRYIKSKFIKLKKNQGNFIFLGGIAIDNSISIGKLILDILDKYYKSATIDIKPLTFIIHDNFVEIIKKYLIGNDVLFNDGYEHIQFNSKLFFSSPIINKKIRGGKATESLNVTSFKVRVLSRSIFETIKKHDITPQIIYYFDSDIIDAFDENSFMSFDKLNTKQIADIFSH